MTTAGLVNTATLGAKQQMTTKTPEEEAVVVYYLRPRSNPKKKNKKKHYSLLQAVKWTKPIATPATAALPDAAQLFAWQLPYLSIYLSFPSLPSLRPISTVKHKIPGANKQEREATTAVT
jgi:hypothetical protein